MHQTLFSANPYIFIAPTKPQNVWDYWGAWDWEATLFWIAVLVFNRDQCLLSSAPPLTRPSHAVRDTMAFVEHMESKVLVGTTFSPLQ